MKNFSRIRIRTLDPQHVWQHRHSQYVHASIEAFYACLDNERKCKY